ncbi:hypothetical protein [Mesorhizobium sp.]|uniref:hypothetical protein n=1 Tax=Mesorhizobium sp. TaxID=1871066 RepID=UPI00257EED69|nr:hypothetical protein [Mesorhizobium sp.]
MQYALVDWGTTRVLSGRQGSVSDVRNGDGVKVRSAHHASLGAFWPLELRSMVGERDAVAPRMEEQVSRGREISHIAPDGEIHRADIKTPSGIVIEVQHSAMTAERLSREAF